MIDEEEQRRLINDKESMERQEMYQIQNKRHQNESANDQSKVSKFDRFAITLLLLIIGFAGFNLIQHYKSVKIPSNIQNDILLEELQNVHYNKIQTQNEIKKDSDSDNSQIKSQEELISQKENVTQIIKPAYSNSINNYIYEELQNGIRILFIESNIQEIHFRITLNIGSYNDPFDKPGLTKLLFKCLQTSFSIQTNNYYTTLTTELNNFEELNDKLQELHNILTKPQFINIQKNANELFNNSMLDSKSGDLQYIIEFLSQYSSIQELKILEVDSDQLQQQYIQYISADTISLIFKTQIDQKMILNQLLQSDLVKIKNLHQFQKADFKHRYPLGKHILKFKSETKKLAILSMNDQFICEKFLSYLLPKPFQGVMLQNHLLVNLEQDIETVLNQTNKFIQFLDYLKQVDEIQLQNLYSQMLSSEELLFNNRYEEDLVSIGQNLFSDPIHALKGQEYLRIFDKKEFDNFLSNLANNFIVIVGSDNFLYNKTHESEIDESIFIMDSMLNKINQGLIYDFKPQVKILNLTNKYEFQLPSQSPFLPEKPSIFSVCQKPVFNQPVFKNQEFRQQRIDDLSLTVKEGKFDGSSEPKFEIVQFVCEYPLPDFQVDCQQKEKTAQFSLTPFQIAKNIWWKPSKLSAMVFKGLFIEKPMSNFSTSNTMIKLLQKYYTELSKTRLQQEFQFGYELSFKESINGLDIQMLSYSEKITEFKNIVFDMIGYEDEKLFLQVKDLLILDAKKFHDQHLSILYEKYYLPIIMLRPINTQQEILNVLNIVTFQQFKKFQESLLSSKLVTLNVGNILPNEDAIQDYQEMQLTKTLKLKGKKLIYVVQRESNDDLTSSVLNYYQTGLQNIEKTSKLHFYVDFLQQYAQNYFQTGQQILINRKSIGCADGLQIYMQDVIPSEGDKKIEKFLKLAHLRLSKLQDKKILEQKQYTINRLQNEIKFKTLQEEGQFIWDKIVNKNYAFSEIQDVIKYLDQALPKELKESSKLVLQGQISVQVYAIDKSIKNITGIKSTDELVNQEVYECFFTL